MSVDDALNNWTINTLPDGGTGGHICWSPELRLFCVTGGNYAYTSPNGKVWTARTLPSRTYPSTTGVAWSPELGKFCIAGYSGPITSPDGIIWTLISGSYAPYTPYTGGICWSPGRQKFAFTQWAYYWVSGNSTNASIHTSEDSVNWTRNVAISGSNPGLSGITWAQDRGIFCAVANRDQASTESMGSNIPNEVWRNSATGVISTDGVTWTKITLPKRANWDRVAWSPELGIFCAIATHETYSYPNPEGTAYYTTTRGINHIATSSTGSSWVSKTLSETRSRGDVAWSPELGFCITGNNGMVEVSIDGINWDSKTFPLTSGGSICWSPELGVFCVVSSNNIAISKPIR